MFHLLCFTQVIEEQVAHMVGVIRKMQSEGHSKVECTKEAEDDWVAHCEELFPGSVWSLCDSWCVCICPAALPLSRSASDSGQVVLVLARLAVAVVASGYSHRSMQCLAMVFLVRG